MNRFFSICALFLLVPVAVAAQISASEVPSNGRMAVSPARFELEMKPGTETTVVVNLDYRAAGDVKEPARIVATLNDWTITPDGRVEFYRANSQPNSASSWLIYSPGEAAVVPGSTHQIRVTISVPSNAAPGDHLAALIIEQRPETLKYEQNLRQVVVRYRMASVFYIKVPGLTKRGYFEQLYAESTPDGVVVTPKLKNDGNSMIRPVASVKVVNADGKVVAEAPDVESIPILAGAQLSKSVLLDKVLVPGNYTVKYRVDFGDGERATEGVTDLVVKTAPQIASSARPPQKP
jgi:methionine-rich copper-binding protein CopC